MNDALMRSVPLALAAALVLGGAVARGQAIDGGPTDGGAAPPVDSAAPTDAAPPNPDALRPAAATEAPTAPAPPPAIVEPPKASRIEIVSRKPRWSLIGGGIGVFLLGYLGDIGVTYGFHHDPGYTSAIPLVGPFLQLSQHYGLDGPPFDTGDKTVDAKMTKRIDDANHVITQLAQAGAAIAGVMQIGGAVMAVLGATLKKTVRRYAGAPGPTISLTPTIAGAHVNVTY
jgi:hypothetical protein